jgi:hypothetical protein
MSNLPPMNQAVGYAVIAFTPVRDDEETADFMIDEETYNARSFNVFTTMTEAKCFEDFIKSKLPIDTRFLITHVDSARTLFNAFVDLNSEVTA